MSPPSKTKKRSKKKVPETKFCKTCHQDILENETRDMLMFKDTYPQLQAKGYCDKHEPVYSNHKCVVDWCGDCGYLIGYQIEIQKGE